MKSDDCFQYVSIHMIQSCATNTSPITIIIINTKRNAILQSLYTSLLITTAQVSHRGTIIPLSLSFVKSLRASIIPFWTPLIFLFLIYFYCTGRTVPPSQSAFRLVFDCMCFVWLIQATRCDQYKTVRVSWLRRIYIFFVPRIQHLTISYTGSPQLPVFFTFISFKTALFIHVIVPLPYVQCLWYTTKTTVRHRRDDRYND